jgi:hypothetical protein
LEIEGRNYKIKEAWVEHPHRGGDNTNSLSKGYDFVMTFYDHPYDSLNFKTYTKDLALGSWKIWFFLNENEYNNDTLVLHYRENLNEPMQKTFKLYKKK